MPTAQTYSNIFQQPNPHPSFLDFLHQGNQAYSGLKTLKTIPQWGSEQMANLGGIFNTQGAAALQPGLASLASMLFNQGQINPAAMNLRIQDIARGTQGAQSQTAGTLASRGLSRSGLGLALMGAQGQAGENRIAQTRAAEDQAAYQRQQQNLQLLKDLIIGPETDLAAIGAGQYGGQQQAKAAKQSAIIGAIGAILGGIAGRK